MKRISVILMSTLLLISGCTFGASEQFQLEAVYIVKSTNEEKNERITISYNHEFDVSGFKVYKNKNGNRTELDKNDYTITWEEGTGEEFYSSTPEVGVYNVIFEHKTKTSALVFEVTKSQEKFETTARLKIDDIDYKSLSQKPSLVGSIDTDYYGDFTARKVNDDESLGASFSYPYRDNQELKMDLVPGKYFVEGKITSNHYLEVTFSTTFNVKKVAFPSNYEVRPNLSFGYIDGCDTLGDYVLPSAPGVFIKESGARVSDENFDNATLEWKNPETPVEVGTPINTKIIFHSDYFFDYEFDVTFTIGN